jgi:hypothetical protein
MNLLDKIRKAKNMAEALANCTIEKHQEVVWIYSFQSDLKKIVDDDLMHNNPDYIFEEYKEYFLTKNLPTKTIDTNTVFYRGRIGNEIIYGAEDAYNRSFILPYYRSGIEAPPPIYAEGGRFNRQGISYLYLADTVETCLAEVHLQIGQNCSVGEFKCKKQIEVIDLTKFCGDTEMKAWLKLLTQPVHNETKRIYNITRFLADVFKSINCNGLYFESVQSEGHNIVCFNPTLFELVEYSERIYTATKIKYNYQQVEDSIREYAKKSTGKYINSYNEYEDEKNNKKFEYLNDWIENEGEKIKRDIENK